MREAGTPASLGPRVVSRKEEERRAAAVLAGKDAQHRDHGPHRRGQDDHHRADPLLHGAILQDRGGPRRHRDHGLDGAGAGAGDHHHLRGDHLLLARLPHQHHRHARPRGLHRRGRALAARARRRGGHPGRGGRAWSPRRRRCGGRPTSTRCPASSTSTRWTASGPTSTAASTCCASAWAPIRWPSRCPSGARTSTRAWSIWWTRWPWCGTRATRRLGKEFKKAPVPADMVDLVREYREKMIEGLAEVDDHLMEKYVAGDAHQRRRAAGGHAQGHHRHDPVSRAVRGLLQEQGGAGPPGRRHRLSALALRHPAPCRGSIRRPARWRSARPPTTPRSPPWPSRS